MALARNLSPAAWACLLPSIVRFAAEAALVGPDTAGEASTFDFSKGRARSVDLSLSCSEEVI